MSNMSDMAVISGMGYWYSDYDMYLKGL